MEQNYQFCYNFYFDYSIFLGSGCLQLRDGYSELRSGGKFGIRERNPIDNFVACGGIPVSRKQIYDWELYDARGKRKYINDAERCRFIAKVDQFASPLRAFCYVLTFTGCRVSEALALGRHNLDLDRCALTLPTLKRRRIVHRVVPIPEAMMQMLLAVPVLEDGRFWKLSRTTAWRWVHRAMNHAGIHGPMGSCKGLRHGFGMRAASCNVPPNLIQRWMGHASPQTTAIYMDAVGAEERKFAARMW